MTEEEKRLRANAHRRSYVQRLREEDPEKLREQRRRYTEGRKLRSPIKHADRQRQYVERRDADPVRSAAAIEAARLRAAKRAADPVRAAEHREKQRRYAAERSADPARHAARLAQQRIWRAAQGKALHRDPNAADGAEATRRVLSENATYRAIDAVVPARYPPHIRDDLISEAFVAVLESQAEPQAIPSVVKATISAFWRDRPDFWFASLDAAFSSNNRSTLHDIVPSDTWETVR